MAASSLLGKVGLVIGGTNGIGRGLAEWLARHGASVVVAGRSRERGNEVVQKMSELSAESKANHSFMPIDASMMADTRRFSREFRASHERLDYVVLTQGIATTQGRTETSEGIDQKMAIHYYGRIAVLQGLMPLLEKTAQSGGDVRVLSVLSGGVHSTYANYKDDVELRQHYSLKNAADAAGFYNDIGLDSLAREHPSITFVHAAPGFVATAWGTELNPVLRGLVRVIQVFGNSPEACANVLGQSLVATDFKGGFQLMTATGTHTKVTPDHEAAREFVWQHTKEILDRFPVDS